MRSLFAGSNYIGGGQATPLDTTIFKLGKFVYRNKPKLFSKGWGDSEVLGRLDRWDAFSQAPEAARVQWKDSGRTQDGIFCRDAQFESQVDFSAIPDECRRAHFRFVLPERHFSGPIYLHLAASGDEGFENRYKNIAVPLAKRGIGSILLENPYFGLRRPKDQFKIRLNYVSDLLLLGAIAVTDVRALLGWCETELGNALGVTGISMGGHLTALASALSTQPLAVVPFVSPHCGTAVFVDGLTAEHIDWQTLSADFDDVAAAKENLRSILRFTSIEALPVPHHHVIQGVCAQNDGVVPLHSSQVWAKHWSHGNYDYVTGGHVKNIVLNKKLYIDKLESTMQLMAQSMYVPPERGQAPLLSNSV